MELKKLSLDNKIDWIYKTYVSGCIAQLVRVLRSHRRGRRFKSCYTHHLKVPIYMRDFFYFKKGQYTFKNQIVIQKNKLYKINNRFFYLFFNIFLRGENESIFSLFFTFKN